MSTVLAITAVVVILALALTLALSFIHIGRLRDDLLSATTHDHDVCVWKVAEYVGLAHEAEVLARAADAYDAASEQGSLRVLAAEKYVAGGPSMPAIWLRERARKVVRR